MQGLNQHPWCYQHHALADGANRSPACPLLALFCVQAIGEPRAFGMDCFHSLSHSLFPDVMLQTHPDNPPELPFAALGLCSPFWAFFLGTDYPCWQWLKLDYLCGKFLSTGLLPEPSRGCKPCCAIFSITWWGLAHPLHDGTVHLCKQLDRCPYWGSKLDGVC